MSRPKPGKLAAFMAILLGLAALPVWVRGGLLITNFEGDLLHLADIVLRMSAGERPHLDFMTPIGALAFWPILPGLGAGLGLGHAFALGQTGFAVLAAIPLWWAAATRLPTHVAYGFSAVGILILTSLAHGYDSGNVAISMHYNRWAWGLAYAATLIAVLPGRQRAGDRAGVDGTFLGLIAVALALLKVTYFVALAPVLFVALMLRGAGWTLAIAVGVGAVAGLAAVVLLGPSYLQAYLGDLLAVIDAPLRDAPGLPWQDLVISPAWLLPTFLVLGAGLILRRMGLAGAGLVILLLLPAWVVITWQNFGNVPMWLPLFAALLAAIYAEEPGKRGPIALIAAIAAAISLPLVAVHGGSGLRLLTLQGARYTALVPGQAALSDLYMPNIPAHLVRVRRVQNDPGQPYAALAPVIDRGDPIVFGGEAFAECQVLTGIKATVEDLSATLAEAPTLPADILSSHWIYGGAPLPGAAPWNYGTLHGLAAAERVLVPLCPVSQRARDAILEALNAAGVAPVLIRKTDTYALFRLERVAPED